MEDNPKILLISGPNLSILGQREPAVYGSADINRYVSLAKEVAEANSLNLYHFISDSEGEIVKTILNARDNYSGIIINAGALTHYSFSLADALAAFSGPKIELHISNPLARERFRHQSVIAKVCSGQIAGFGLVGYKLAVLALVEILKVQKDK